MKCLVCRDGTELVGDSEVCPECGTEINVSKGKAESVNKPKRNILVPKYYRGRVFDSKKLVDSKFVGEENSQLLEYSNNLKKIMNIFNKDCFQDKSFMIISDKGYGKKVLAYTIINYLNKNGYKVSNIKDTYTIINDLKDNKEYIVDDDYLFIRVQNIFTEYAFNTIEHILELRSSMDKGTMILSNHSLSKLSKNIYSSELYKKNENKLRYPYIIEGVDLD